MSNDNTPQKNADDNQPTKEIKPPLRQSWPVSNPRYSAKMRSDLPPLPRATTEINHPFPNTMRPRSDTGKTEQDTQHEAKMARMRSIAYAAFDVFPSVPSRKIPEGWSRFSISLQRKEGESQGNWRKRGSSLSEAMSEAHKRSIEYIIRNTGDEEIHPDLKVLNPDANSTQIIVLARQGSKLETLLNEGNSDAILDAILPGFMRPKLIDDMPYLTALSTSTIGSDGRPNLGATLLFDVGPGQRR